MVRLFITLASYSQNMLKLIEFLRNYHHQIFKVFLFLVAVITIVFIFPREGKFKYEFQKGKPWPHEDLIADFDFPIYKSEEKLRLEKESIEASQPVYFFENRKLSTEAKEEFDLLFDREWSKLLGEESGSLAQLNIKEKEQYFRKGKKIIDSIYSKGLIELHPSIEGKPKDFEILVLRNNVAVPTKLSEVYSISSAFELIRDELSELNAVEKELLLNAIEECLKRNLSYDQETNEHFLELELQKISPSSGMIQEGERVIAKGDILNDDRYQILLSLKKEFESEVGSASKTEWILIGQALLVSLMILSLALFLLNFRRDIIRSDLKISFLLLLIILYVLASKYAIDSEILHLYIVPFCMLPLIIRTFFDLRVALYTYLVAILIVGFIAPNPYEFIIIQMMAGILTLYSVMALQKRSQLFISALIIFAVYTAVYVAIGLIQEGTVLETDWKFLGWFLLSALLTLFTYPLVYVFEKIFGFVSDVTLMELSDTNSKLLRKLNMKAPGTFQHSLQVANLAEEAIRAVGGNALLVRTGALYHDIGKMGMPSFFIENQNSDHNPHDELDPEESAAIIIDHVIRGIEMGRRYKLPDMIIDFIRTHHGTTKTQFFLKKYKEEHPEEELDESKFRYPGPIPYSKETAVLMMADSVEAASRSLKTYDGEGIEKLVNGIIDHQVSEDQFVMSNITFSDLTLIKKMFKKKLMSIYHVRVEYPE